MKRAIIYAICILVVIGAAAAAIRLNRPEVLAIDTYTDVARLPQLSPDYTNITLPANIAPLNFVVQEKAEHYLVKVSAATGQPIEVRSDDGNIEIPATPWRQLLEANRGDKLQLDVFIKPASAAWQKFQTVTNSIALEPIDSYLAYRLIPPMQHKWRKIGIYQRDLESFGQTTVIENRSFGRNGCVNCHTFKQNSAQTMSFQIRSPDHGRPMMIIKDGEILKVKTSTGEGISAAAYHTWHPNVDMIAFARIKPAPFEHTAGDTRDVWDADSDLAVYFLETNKVEAPPAISDPDRRETWPSWSSDGKHLYFASAPQVPFKELTQVRYDLMRVSYDIATNTWGQPQVLVAASQSKLSAAEPRESPDGRWLLFCMAKYGNFPVFRRSSDLYLMDMQTLEYRRLAINSDRSDSWHSWSSNSSWVAFASKRDSELLSRVYFTHVNSQGHFTRPFVLPQQDPTFYDSFLLTFNVPELVIDRITVTQSQLGRAISSKTNLITAEYSPTLPRKAEPQAQAPTATPEDG